MSRKPIPVTGSCLAVGCGPAVMVVVRRWFRDQIQLRCFACRRVLTREEAAIADAVYLERWTNDHDTV